MNECPSEQTILDYAADELAGPIREQLEQHLSQCETCSEAVRWVKVHLLRSSETMDATTAEDSRDRARDDKQTYGLTFNFDLLEPSKREDTLGRLGDYEVLEVVGRGGMGVVFKAHDDRLRRIVAIKALNRSLASSSTARRRFIREARAAAAINHPNVVTIHAVEDYHDLPFIVMEFLSGPSLRELMRRKRRIDPMDAVRMSAQIATGLAAAHAQGVIHRDVKPGNVMSEDGIHRIKITDFGLARAAIDNVELTSRELAVGTPAYMAPEQVRGQSVDSRVDLFALGCVMYAMMAGHSPFHGKHALEIARKVTEYNPAALHAVNERTPLFFSEIVMRLLEKSPDRRYQSAMEVAEVLNNHISVFNQAASDEISSLFYGKRAKSSQRTPWSRKLAFLVPCTIILVAVALLWFPGRSDRPDSEPTSQPGASASAVLPESASLPDRISSTTTQRLTGVLRVGRGDDAEFKSLSSALAVAGPGASIEITDDATYDEHIVIDDASRWSGISIVGTGPELPTVTTSEPAIVLIADTPGIRLSRLRIHPTKANQHALDIRGECPGVTVDHVELINRFDDGWALVLISNGASGTVDRPIEIRESSFAAKLMGVVVQGIGQSVSNVRLMNNQFSGTARHLQFNHLTPSVTARGNLFIGGTGVALTMIPESSGVVVANNTFFMNDIWLNLRHSSPEATDMRIVNNLILGSASSQLLEQGAPASLDRYGSQWDFRSNHWEGDFGEDEALQTIAELHAEIDTLSRDRSEKGAFLRIPADSPLATAGIGDPFCRYIGAFPPEEDSARKSTD